MSFIRSQGDNASLRDIGRHLALSENQAYRSQVRRHGGLYRFVKAHATSGLALQDQDGFARDNLVELRETGESITPSTSATSTYKDLGIKLASTAKDKILTPEEEALHAERLANKENFWEEQASRLGRTAEIHAQSKQTPADVDDDVWNDMQQVLMGKKLRPSAASIAFSTGKDVTDDVQIVDTRQVKPKASDSTKAIMAEQSITPKLFDYTR